MTQLSVSTGLVGPTGDVRPRLRVRPVLIGTGAVGARLRVELRTFDGTAPPPTRYRWMSRGTAVAGGETDSFTVRPEDAGAYVYCALRVETAYGSVLLTTPVLPIWPNADLPAWDVTLGEEGTIIVTRAPGAPLPPPAGDLALELPVVREPAPEPDPEPSRPRSQSQSRSQIRSPEPETRAALPSPNRSPRPSRPRNRSRSRRPSPNRYQSQSRRLNQSRCRSPTGPDLAGGCGGWGDRAPRRAAATRPRPRRPGAERSASGCRSSLGRGRSRRSVRDPPRPVQSLVQRPLPGPDLCIS